jgi:hypothetical protein
LRNRKIMSRRNNGKEKEEREIWILKGRNVCERDY